MKLFLLCGFCAAFVRRGTQPTHGESGTFQARRLKVLVFIVES
jgi:hypothetical protein